MPRILLLGGAGKIALHLTPLLLARGSSYHLTSVIRNPDQTETIVAAAKGQPGTCNVLMRSLEEVTSEEQAKGIIEESEAEWVVWSAGKLETCLTPFVLDQHSKMESVSDGV